MNFEVDFLLKKNEVVAHTTKAVALETFAHSLLSLPVVAKTSSEICLEGMHYPARCTVYTLRNKRINTLW